MKAKNFFLDYIDSDLNFNCQYNYELGFIGDYKKFKIFRESRYICRLVWTKLDPNITANDGNLYACFFDMNIYYFESMIDSEKFVRSLVIKEKHNPQIKMVTNLRSNKA